jgi:hypothetical protein
MHASKQTNKLTSMRRKSQKLGILKMMIYSMAELAAKSKYSIAIYNKI